MTPKLRILIAETEPLVYVALGVLLGVLAAEYVAHRRITSAERALDRIEPYCI